MGAFIGRTLRAMVRRAAEGDREVLSVLQAVAADLDRAQVAAARAAHDFGYSWTDIGREMGITRQAARQRFAPTDDAAVGRYVAFGLGVVKCRECSTAATVVLVSDRDRQEHEAEAHA